VTVSRLPRRLGSANNGIRPAPRSDSASPDEPLHQHIATQRWAGSGSVPALASICARRRNERPILGITSSRQELENVCLSQLQEGTQERPLRRTDTIQQVVDPTERNHLPERCPNDLAAHRIG